LFHIWINVIHFNGFRHEWNAKVPPSQQPNIVDNDQHRRHEHPANQFQRPQHGSESTRLADAWSPNPRRQSASERTAPRSGRQPHPVLDEAALGALFTPADQRSAAQAARVALDDALIAQVQA
jgi:hypothetical protein